MAGTIRSFLAIALPEPVADALDAAAEGLRAGNPVPVENMHLTLAFLGDVRGPDLEELDDTLQRLRAPLVPVAFTEWGVFGGGAPRSLHAAVSTDPALRHLQAKVEQAARGVGLDLPRRRFLPHVTVARFRGTAADAPEVTRFLFRHPLPAMDSFEADEVVLYRSTLTRYGPEYDEMERYSFAFGSP